MEFYWFACVVDFVDLLIYKDRLRSLASKCRILRLVFADMQLSWRNVCMLSICISRGCLPLHCVWQLVYFRVYSTDKSDKKANFIPERRNNFIVHSKCYATLQGIVYELFIICCGLSRQSMLKTKILKRQH